MQLSLWMEDQQVAVPAQQRLQVATPTCACWMLLIYYDGKRRVIDANDPRDADTIGDVNVWSAGYVYEESEQVRGWR